MRTFEVTGPVTLSVECPTGDVDVETTDAPRAEVAVTPLRDDETSREAVENTVVELRGDTLVVDVPRRAGSFFGREPSIRIEVRVPDGSGLRFRTGSADVGAAGRYGEVRGKTASGDVRLAEAASVDVETASGDVEVEVVHGPVRVRSASGDVVVGSAVGPVVAGVVSGDLRVRAAERGGAFAAVSGDVEVGTVASGDVEVRTVSGDAVIGVATGSRVHVDVSTVSGDLRSDVPLDEAPGPDAEGPLVTVHGRTVSGDLRIRSALALDITKARHAI